MKYRTDLILGEAFRGLESENRENDKMQKLTNCTMLKHCLRGFIQLVLLTIGSISAIDSKVVTAFSLPSILTLVF